MAHYYTTKQAAEYLGYSAISIRRFVRQGKLVPSNSVGHPRFTQMSLDAFARRGRLDSPASLYSAVVPTLNKRLQEALSK